MKKSQIFTLTLAAVITVTSVIVVAIVLAENQRLKHETVSHHVSETSSAKSDHQMASKPSGHGHHSLAQAAQPYPTLEVEAVADAVGGYNLTITATNFAFAPTEVNGEVRDNAGHAHMYINGLKSRLYSPYVHISGGQLRPGNNDIRVTLNANNHGVYAIDGVEIEATTEINH